MGQTCVSGGIVVFAPLQFVLIVVQQSVTNFEEGKGGIERPTNTLLKLGGNAACLMVILLTDDSVERLQRVGATVALARVTTMARPPCLGTGAVARVAGTLSQTEAAEVLTSRRCLLMFTIPTSHRGCTCRG